MLDRTTLEEKIVSVAKSCLVIFKPATAVAADPPILFGCSVVFGYPKDDEPLVTLCVVVVVVVEGVVLIVVVYVVNVVVVMVVVEVVVVVVACSE